MISALLSGLALLLAAAYAALQLWFAWKWRSLPAPPKRDPMRRWSIVIAARNEAHRLSDESIHGLLSGLAPDWQSFGRDHHEVRPVAEAPPYEVIVVDDHSSDGTAEVAARFPHVRVLVLPKGATGKKAALAYGIAHASGDWIATLDADVRVRQDWLRHLDNATHERVAVAGPVELYGTSWLARWQALDFCGMMVVTGASLRAMPFAMGNGANLAFAKTAYEAVGGYASEDGRVSASGDDMVLLGKLKAKFPGQVAFAKTHGAIASTPAQATLGGFIRQRWRWSAKTGLNHQPALTLTLAIVWLFHVGLWLGLPLAFLGLLSAEVVAGAWLTKAVCDFALLWTATDWFGRRDLLTWTYPLDSIAHAAYVAGIGLLALLPIDFEWKGRRARV